MEQLFGHRNNFCASSRIILLNHAYVHAFWENLGCSPIGPQQKAEFLENIYTEWHQQHAGRCSLTPSAAQPNWLHRYGGGVIAALQKQCAELVTRRQLCVDLPLQ